MYISRDFKINLTIFLIVVFFSYILDISRNKCKNLTFEIKINNLFHHIMSNYFWFGSLILGFHEFHILYMICGYIGWEIFGGCYLTIQYNNVCNYDKKQKHNDLLYLISGNETIFKQMSLFKIIFMYNIFSIIRKYYLLY